MNTNERKIKEVEEALDKEKIIITCSYCGKTTKMPVQVAGYLYYFCSQDCAQSIANRVSIGFIAPHENWT